MTFPRSTIRLASGSYSKRCADGAGIPSVVTPNEMCPRESCPVDPQIACAPGNEGTETGVTCGPTDSVILDGRLPDTIIVCPATTEDARQTSAAATEFGNFISLPTTRRPMSPRRCRRHPELMESASGYTTGTI